MRTSVLSTVDHTVRGVRVTPPARPLSPHLKNVAHVLVIGGNCEARLEIASAFHRQTSSRALERIDARRDEERLVLALRAWTSSAPMSPEAGWLREAEGGTLFVDSVGDLSPPAQNSLLHFACQMISERWDESRASWSGRLVVGNREPLIAAVEDGRFSAALYDVVDKVRIELDAGETVERFGRRGPNSIPRARSRRVAHRKAS